MKNQVDRQYDQIIKMIRKLRPVPQRDVAALATGRAKFLADADLLKQTVSITPEQRHNGWFYKISNQSIFSQKERTPMYAIFVSVFVALALFFGGAGATAYAAQDSLPGDILYPLKTATEDLRLSLSLDAEGDLSLYQQFTQQRVNEISALASRGRYDDITQAASRFGSQYQQASLIVDALSNKDSALAAQLSQSFNKSMSSQEATLNTISTGVSDKARLSIEKVLGESHPWTKIEFVGLVQSMSTDSWVIAGRTVAITLSTDIEGDILVNDLVKVKAFIEDDGSLIAHEIEPILAGEEFNFTGVVQTIGTDFWVVSSQTVKITSATKIEAGIVVGDLVRVQSLVEADGSLTAHKIGFLENKGGNDFEISGVVEAIGDGFIVVGGHEIVVTQWTHFKDEVKIGDFVKVKGTVAIDGTLIARQVGLFKGDEDENGNDDSGNDNGDDNDNNGNDDNGNDNSGDDENGNDDNGNHNGDDNGHDDDNGNGNNNNNGNDNGHDDDDENGNGNGNGSGNDNGHDDDNGNGNGTGNDNGHDDDNGNGSGNDNGHDDNGNDNDNDNGGGHGGNDNDDDRSSTSMIFSSFPI